MRLCQECVKGYCIQYETNICGTCMKELPFEDVTYDKLYMEQLIASCKKVLKSHYDNGGVWFEPSLENMLNIVNSQDDIYDDLEYYMGKTDNFNLFLSINLKNHMINKIFLKSLKDCFEIRKQPLMG